MGKFVYIPHGSKDEAYYINSKICDKFRVEAVEYVTSVHSIT
ncbi:hypothetical protein P4H58_04585 [Bacillus cereus]|nr:hypothetical protein [Bacillus cereus]